MAVQKRLIDNRVAELNPQSPAQGGTILGNNSTLLWRYLLDSEHLESRRLGLLQSPLGLLRLLGRLPFLLVLVPLGLDLGNLVVKFNRVDVVDELERLPINERLDDALKVCKTRMSSRVRSRWHMEFDEWHSQGGTGLCGLDALTRAKYRSYTLPS